MVRNTLSLVKFMCIVLPMATLSSQALATYSNFEVNSMCYLADKKNAGVQAFNPTAKQIKESASSLVKKKPTDVTVNDLYTKFRIASLSKILVSHWAVATLTPEYRFKTKVHVLLNQTKGNECDIHFEGDKDIFFGKEILTNAFKQLIPTLNSNNCSRIGEITFDENIDIPYGDSGDVFSHRNDKGIRWNEPTRYYTTETTKNALSRLAKSVLGSANIKIGAVQFLEKGEFKSVHKDTPRKTFSFQSRPLHMMLREFNAYSYNIPPNILFEKLGGREAYNKFIKTRLGLDTHSVDVYNGSGYPAKLDGVKTYNEVTCDALVRIIQDLDHLMRSYKGSRPFQMADIMGIGGSSKTLARNPDGSVKKDKKGNDVYITEGFTTFKGQYDNDKFTNTLVGKTGSADLAITFGGMLSTTEGNIYFAALTAPKAYEGIYTSPARSYIRDLVAMLAKQYELDPFEYTNLGLMNAIDKEATLVEEIPNLAAPMNLSLK